MKWTRELTGMIVVVIGVFGVLLTMLALQGMPGQQAAWNTVAGNVAPFFLLILAVGVVVAVITRR